MKAKLTIRTVESVQPAEKDVILWDTELAGFGCKITPQGRRAYFLYYRTRDHRQRRPTIGVHGAMKPEKAREIALQWAAEVAAGGDPAATRAAGREAPTVKVVCQRYLEQHAATRKRDSSQAEDARLIKKQINPVLGNLKISAVKRSDVARLHSSLSATPYLANRVLALLSKVFSLAEQWEIRAPNTNPAREIERFPERKRERFLSADELQRLAAALDADEAAKLADNRGVAPAIRLLVLTGCRLSEILTLEWRFVDRPNKLLRLPVSKTGAKVVPLSAAALQLLKDLRADAAKKAKYVCIGGGKDGRIVNLQKSWRRIRKSAGLTDVRLHDLRHTYASFGAGAGLSLPMIGKLLGHKHTATTARYAHLADDPVRQGVELIGGRLASAFVAAALSDDAAHREAADVLQETAASASI